MLDIVSKIAVRLAISDVHTKQHVGEIMNKVLMLVLFLNGCGSAFGGVNESDVMRMEADFTQEISRLEEKNEAIEERLVEHRVNIIHLGQEGLACAWAMSYIYSEFGADHAHMCAEEDEYSCDLIEFAFVCGLGGAQVYGQSRMEEQDEAVSEQEE